MTPLRQTSPQQTPQCKHPPLQTPPPGQTPPFWADTPSWADTPLLGRHPPPGQTGPGQTPPRQTPSWADTPGWSMRRWYASYWNAFLCCCVLVFFSKYNITCSRMKVCLILLV